MQQTKNQSDRPGNVLKLNQRKPTFIIFHTGISAFWINQTYNSTVRNKDTTYRCTHATNSAVRTNKKHGRCKVSCAMNRLGINQLSWCSKFCGGRTNALLVSSNLVCNPALLIYDFSCFVWGVACRGGWVGGGLSRETGGWGKAPAKEPYIYIYICIYIYCIIYIHIYTYVMEYISNM